MDKESDGGEAHLDLGKMVEFSDFGKEEDKASAKTRHLSTSSELSKSILTWPRRQFNDS